MTWGTRMTRNVWAFLGIMLLLAGLSPAHADDERCWEWDRTGPAIMQDTGASGAYLQLGNDMESNDIVPYLTFPSFPLCQSDDDMAYQVRPLGIGQINGRPLHFAYRCMGGRDLELMGQNPEDISIIIATIASQQPIEMKVGVHAYHGANCNGLDALKVTEQSMLL